MSYYRSLIVFFFIACLSGAFLSCQNNTARAATDPGEATAEQEENANNQFGEPITAEGAISYERLLAEMEEKDSVEVKVRGSVSAVCQAKGCWMNIVSNEGGKEEMFVKFKDYGFFMPKDIAGREVIMEGKAFREVTPVDELRHYAEDNGESAEAIAAITEPKVELKFLASGVILLEE